MVSALELDDTEEVLIRAPFFDEDEAFTMAPTERYAVYAEEGKEGILSSPEPLIGTRMTLGLSHARFQRREDVPVERVRSTWMNCTSGLPQTGMPYMRSIEAWASSTRPNQPRPRPAVAHPAQPRWWDGLRATLGSWVASLRT